MRRNCALKLPLSWLLIHNGLSNFAVLFTKMSCTIYTILIKCLHNKSQPIPKRFIRMTNNRWFTNWKRNTWMQSKCKQLCIDDSNCLENDFSGEIRRFLRCALYFLSLCLGVRSANTELPRNTQSLLFTPNIVPFWSTIAFTGTVLIIWLCALFSIR